MPVQKPTFITHHPGKPLVVDSIFSLRSQTSVDKTVALGGAVFDHVGNDLLDDSVIVASG